MVKLETTGRKGILKEIGNMDRVKEIEWLMGCRKHAQETVDKITLRIAELQENKDDQSVGFKK